MGLEDHRAEIDELDQILVRTLARRVAVCRDVAEFKARTDTPMMQPDRVAAVKDRAVELGERYGLDAGLVRGVYDLLITETCRVEDELIAELHRNPPHPAPVFVGGDDRSGTTLVSVVLDSHPDLVVGPELDFLQPVDLGPHLRECCRLLMADSPLVRGAGVQTADPHYALGVQFARQVLRFGVSHQQLDELAAAAMQRTGSDLVTPDERLALIEQIGLARCAATGKSRWGIKIQRGIAAADRLVSRWPGAQFVHVVRDGRDVAASHLGVGRSWNYRSAEEAAAGWVAVVEAVGQVVPAGDLFELRYEDLVGEPEPVMRNLLQFLDIAWDDRVLRHTESEHALFANPFEHPSAEAARRPIGGNAVGRYLQDLDAAQVAAFESIAAPTLRRHGYRVAP